MKPHACLLLLAALTACVVCCHAHRAPDPDAPGAYASEVKYEQRHDRETYKKEEGYTHEDKKEYAPKEYSGEYDKYDYNYKSRDKPPKEYKEDYGPPPYNPKAYENYEYDRYHSYSSYPPGYPDYQKPYEGGYPNYLAPYKVGYPNYPAPYEGKYPNYPAGPNYPGYPGYEAGPDSYERYPEGYETPEEPYDGYNGYEGPQYPEEESYESYNGGYGYDEKLPDCRNPHKWPLAWAPLLCVNPKSGVLKYYNESAYPQTCLGFDGNSGTAEHPAVCVQWPGTDYSCTFKFSHSTKPCREAKDKCDVTEYCTGTWWACPSDNFASNDILCRRSRGPCEFNAYCTGGTAECPDNYVSQGQPCGDPDKPLAGPCDAPDVCTGSDFKCPDTFRDSSYTCRSADGPCDLADTCTGNSVDCPDTVRDNTYVCNADTRRPCILGGRCDGTAKTCPALKHAPTGTPCNKDGLWEEAFDGAGKVALKSRYSKEHADMHGWAECDRCYEGECQTFKWEYWNADNKHGDNNGDHPKSDKNGGGSGNGDGSTTKKSSSKKSYKHSGGSYKGSKHAGHKVSASALSEEQVVEFEAEGTSEYYPTKIFETLGVDASIQSSSPDGDHHFKAMAAYEPEVYCHNPYSHTDYNAPKDA